MDENLIKELSKDELTPEVTPEVTPEPEPEEEEPQTVFEDKALEEDEPEEEPSKEEVVPLAAFLELKKELKELKKTKNDIISSDIDELSEKYNVDANFLSDLYGQLENKLSQKYEARLAENQKESKKEQAFNQIYDSFMESNPEYKEVANKEIIKQLAFNPSNTKRKIGELIKEAYKPAKVEKKYESMEPSTPSTQTYTKDFANPSPELMEAMQSDPKLRAEYGNWLEKNMIW